jgi:hypothetical protein
MFTEAGAPSITLVVSSMPASPAQCYPSATVDSIDRLRSISKYSWIVVGVAAILMGAILFFRWQENRDIERRAREQAIEKQRTENRRTVEMLGGNRFEILQFYASPGIIRPGETVQLCYGVSNAKSIRLEPPVKDIWPSFGRCVDAAPLKDTTYTLTIDDGAGNSKSAIVYVRVR